jgi:hypothetical protein
MGSLICYDAFARNPAAVAGKVFVSFGSQIGHPAVRDVFAGRIVMLAARDWYHLYNADDHVFTWPLSIAAPNFRQVDTEFDIPNDWLNHTASWYLDHPNAEATVWHDLSGAAPARTFVSIAQGFERAAQRPSRRALLVGINDYPDPANRLEGCVNDVYLMSALLQEGGFLPEEVRVVLNDRATAAGIESRLHWLLDGVRDGDERFLFYSGHGAQLPEYGPRQEPDHVDECLVPYDFDWTSARAITDKVFCELYAQLPYESRFVAVLDCCHSGGMTRDGMPRIRGLTAPDDIRHRAMKWDADERMWIARRFPPMHAHAPDSRRGAAYFGEAGATRRFGGGASLRTLARKQYVATRKAMGHEGPYLPVLLEACQENGLSYEYKNGATSYGAFTFCLVQALRTPRQPRRALTYAELDARIAAKLRHLDYPQAPNLVGPKTVIAGRVPWAAARAAARPRPRPGTPARSAR